MKGIQRIFYKLALHITSLPVFRKMYSPQVQEQLKVLNPTVDKKELTKKYYAEKISLILMVLSFGSFMVLMVFFIGNTADTELLYGENHLNRGDYGSDPVEVTLKVNAMEDSGESRESNITYAISGRYYSPGEITGYVEQFVANCESLISGENQSLNEVSSNLQLASAYKGYPMEFQWKSEDYTLLGSDGTIHNETLTDSRAVTLTAVITYGEQEFEHSFPVRICPKEYTFQEKWEQAVESAIQEADADQKYTGELVLPEKIQGKVVSYSLIEEKNPVIYIVLLILVSILLFFGKDNDLKQETERRKQEMSRAYPEFISKFIILLGTGMSIRSVFYRLSEDNSLGNYLHRELQLLVRDLNNGLLESEALDRFGKRSGNPLYIKFCALLIQNLKKGNRDLLSMLKSESEEAFLLRKNHAKQMGEEVGTKLLAPMIIMLGVVMVLIMVPALLSFRF